MLEKYFLSRLFVRVCQAEAYHERSGECSGKIIYRRIVVCSLCTIKRSLSAISDPPLGWRWPLCFNTTTYPTALASAVADRQL